MIARGDQTFHRPPDMEHLRAQARAARAGETDITKAVAAAADRVAAFTDGLKQGRIMNKLTEAAHRIKAKQEMHNAKGDEWLKRLDALDHAEPAAFAAGDAALAARETDLKGMEETVRTLGNLGAA